MTVAVAPGYRHTLHVRAPILLEKNSAWDRRQVVRLHTGVQEVPNCCSHGRTCSRHSFQGFFGWAPVTSTGLAKMNNETTLWICPVWVATRSRTSLSKRPPADTERQTSGRAPEFKFSPDREGGQAALVNNERA